MTGNFNAGKLNMKRDSETFHLNFQPRVSLPVTVTRTRTPNRRAIPPASQGTHRRRRLPAAAAAAARISASGGLGPSRLQLAADSAWRLFMVSFPSQVGPAAAQAPRQLCKRAIPPARCGPARVGYAQRASSRRRRDGIAVWRQRKGCTPARGWGRSSAGVRLGRWDRVPPGVRLGRRFSGLWGRRKTALPQACAANP